MLEEKTRPRLEPLALGRKSYSVTCKKGAACICLKFNNKASSTSNRFVKKVFFWEKKSRSRLQKFCSCKFNKSHYMMDLNHTVFMKCKNLDQKQNIKKHNFKKE